MLTWRMQALDVLRMRDDDHDRPVRPSDSAAPAHRHEDHVVGSDDYYLEVDHSDPNYDGVRLGDTLLVLGELVDLLRRERLVDTKGDVEGGECQDHSLFRVKGGIGNGG